jgi:hypothetical protein
MNPATVEFPRILMLVASGPSSSGRGRWSTTWLRLRRMRAGTCLPARVHGPPPGFRVIRDPKGSEETRRFRRPVPSGFRIGSGGASPSAWRFQGSGLFRSASERFPVPKPRFLVLFGTGQFRFRRSRASRGICGSAGFPKNSSHVFRRCSRTIAPATIGSDFSVPSQKFPSLKSGSVSPSRWLQAAPPSRVAQAKPNGVIHSSSQIWWTSRWNAAKGPDSAPQHRKCSANLSVSSRHPAQRAASAAGR